MLTFSNLPVDTTLKVLAKSTIKARWTSSSISNLKEELGLDHFEGRSWHGLHRHALMTMIAYAFLQHHASQAREAGKKESTSHPHTAKPASACHAILAHIMRHCICDVRTVGDGSARHSAEMHSAKVVRIRVAKVLESFGDRQRSRARDRRTG